MKKFSSYSILCFVLITQCGILSAQTERHYGLHGGYNFATQFGDTYSNLGFRFNIILGGFMEMVLDDQLSVQAEVNYSAEGARNRNLNFSESSSVVYDQRLKYNYFQFPIMVKYALDNGLSLTAGPQMGIRLVAKEKRVIKSGEPSPSDNTAGTRRFTGRTKTFYPSVLFGVEYPVIDRLKAQARLQTSIFDNVRRNASDSEGTYPLIFQLSVTYELHQE